MFFLCIIIAIIILGTVLIKTTFIKIEIRNLEFNYPKKENKFFGNDFQINLAIYLFRKIRVLNFDFAKFKLEKDIKEKIIKNKKDADIRIIDVLKEINIEIEKIDIKANIGLEDAALTAIIIGIIYTVVSTYVNAKIGDNVKPNIQINPIYNENIINAKFECIIKTKLIHIIYIIYILNKKGRVKKNGGASNRRSYAYSNE